MSTGSSGWLPLSWGNGRLPTGHGPIQPIDFVQNFLLLGEDNPDHLLLS
jgi:hypothetical protein